MDWREIFLHQHAIVHSEATSNSGEWSLQDSVLNGLTDEQLRQRPERPGTNSIAWLFWHMSRTEDVAVNYILAAQPQVLDDEWVRRLGLSRLDIGTSMTDEEVADTSSRLNIEAMLDYRLVVGKRTREIVRQLDLSDLEGRVDKERIGRLLNDGALVEGARRVAEFWGSGTKLLILNMPATGHAFMHLAEAISIRRELKL